MAFHQDLAQGRWQQLSLVEQLGNIGSEVGRALSARRAGNQQRQQQALERALELLDLTIADKRWRKRLKEITRAREIVVDYFLNDNHYQTKPQSLEHYFMQFALVARRTK